MKPRRPISGVQKWFSDGNEYWQGAYFLLSGTVLLYRPSKECCYNPDTQKSIPSQKFIYMTCCNFTDHYSIAISWKGAFTLLYFLSYFELIYVSRVLFLLSFSLSQTAYESTTWQSTRSSPRTALTSDVDGWEMNPPSPDRYNSDPEANPQPEIELQTMTLDMTSGE